MMPSALASLFKSYPQQADRIKAVLIRQLEEQNALRRRAAVGSLSEEESNYYGDLIAAVAALKDPRALRGLLGAMKTGNMATSALAAFGRLALGPVLEKLNDGRSDTLTRSAAVDVISKMLDSDNLPAEDSASRMEIGNALIKAARGKDPLVRLSAVEGLSKLPGADITALLEGLAKDDPYQASSYGGAKGVYPVREAAKKALKVRK